MDDWEKLTDEQKQGIDDAMEEIDSGKGIVHAKVMENIRKKYPMSKPIICSI